MLITSAEFFPNENCIFPENGELFFLFLEIANLKLDFGLSDTQEKDLTSL